MPKNEIPVASKIYEDWRRDFEKRIEGSISDLARWLASGSDTKMESMRRNLYSVRDGKTIASGDLLLAINHWLENHK